MGVSLFCHRHRDLLHPEHRARRSEFAQCDVRSQTTTEEEKLQKTDHSTCMYRVALCVVGNQLAQQLSLSVPSAVCERYGASLRSRERYEAWQHCAAQRVSALYQLRTVQQG